MMERLPHVMPEMLEAQYWLDRAPEADARLMDAAAVAAFNTLVLQRIGVPDVFALPDTLPGEDVRALVPGVPDDARFGVNGAALGEDVWLVVRANMALDRLPEPVPVRYALATRHAPVRALPTNRLALKTPGDLPFDRLSETMIDLGWPVAVLHTSADGMWAFGLTPRYWGWVETRMLAFASRADVRAFARAQPFLMAVGSWADVAMPGEHPHRVAQMASRLPLLGSAEGDARRVQIPRANAAGRLMLVEGVVSAADPDWHVGLLPLTLRTVFTQAFRMLGEPYAWGGMRLGRAGRDCSGLMCDVWASAGVYLPRNSDQQGRMGRTAAVFEPDEPNESRLRRLAAQVPPGALLFLPGHVMLYLGMVGGTPYAIHDLWNYAHPEGHVTRAARVVVSALPVEPSASHHTLLERLTHAQVIAL